MKTVKVFLDGILGSPDILTTPKTSIFDIGRQLGWNNSDAETEILGVLAVEVAVSEHMDVSGEEHHWISEPFSMQSILREGFLLQKKLTDQETNMASKRKHIQKQLDSAQKSLEIRKAHSEKVLKQASLDHSDEVDREMKLARRNVQNRKLTGVKKARKVRAADALCQQEARCVCSQRTLNQIVQLNGPVAFLSHEAVRPV